MTFDTSERRRGVAVRCARTEILQGAWLPPAAPKAEMVTLRDYSKAWLADRDLADRTREDYDHVLRDHVLPALGDRAVARISPALVRDWHARLKDMTGPTQRPTPTGCSARS